MTTKTATFYDWVYDWVDERLGLSDLVTFARKKTVPVHAQSFWYWCITGPERIRSSRSGRLRT